MIEKGERRKVMGKLKNVASQDPWPRSLLGSPGGLGEAEMPTLYSVWAQESSGCAMALCRAPVESVHSTKRRQMPAASGLSGCSLSSWQVAGSIYLAGQKRGTEVFAVSMLKKNPVV